MIINFKIKVKCLYIFLQLNIQRKIRLNQTNIEGNPFNFTVSKFFLLIRVYFADIHIFQIVSKDCQMCDFNSHNFTQSKFQNFV